MTRHIEPEEQPEPEFDPDEAYSRFEDLIQMLWFTGQLNPEDPDFDYQSREALECAELLPDGMLTSQEEADVRTLRSLRKDYDL